MAANSAVAGGAGASVAALPVGRVEQIHAKCGGIVVTTPEGLFAETEDCPICAEVRANFLGTGNNRASAGTPLARELGLRIASGTPGIVSPGHQG